LEVLQEKGFHTHQKTASCIVR